MATTSHMSESGFQLVRAINVWSGDEGWELLFYYNFYRFGLAALLEHPPQVRFRDFMSVDRDFDADRVRHRVAAREVDDDLLDGLAGHLLGGMHGVADGLLGLVHADDGAVLDAFARLLADAGDARHSIWVLLGDEATDLAAADVERRDQTTICHFLGLSS